MLGLCFLCCCFGAFSTLWSINGNLCLSITGIFFDINFSTFVIYAFSSALQNEIAVKAGVWAEQNISIEKMEENLLSDKSLKEMHGDLEEKADDFIRNKLTERILLLKMFITEGIIIQAKEVLVEQLDKMIPELIKGFIPKVAEKINIKNAVEIRIKNYPLQHLEMEMKKQVGKKLITIKLIAAAAGLLLGIAEISLVIF